MRRLLVLLAALALLAAALLAAGLLIWAGESDQELWATFDTINGAPSAEIVP